MNQLRRTLADGLCHDCTSRALDAFRCYKRDLYSHFDVRSSNRLTRAVKACVDDTLADLRHDVLRAEVAAPGQSPVRAVWSELRREIDMTRRALALRREHPDDDISAYIAELAVDYAVTKRA